MERFDYAKGGELVSVDILSPTSFKIALTVQDKNRAFDWVNLNFECSETSDAKLVSDAALKAIDMEEGINISFEEEFIRIGFGSDEYLSSPLSLCTNTLKYEESPFSL
jgi:hypothetical protein